MKRKIIVAVVVVLAGALAAAGFFGSKWAHRRVVNREFCALRARMDEARAKYLSPDEVIKSESAIEMLYRESIEDKVCEAAFTSVAPWKSETEELNDDNRAAFTSVEKGDCELPRPCPALIESEEWIDLAEWISPPSHRTKLFDETEAKHFERQLAHLHEITPLVKQQKSDDAKLLCDGARDLGRARKLIGFYDGRCPTCAKRRDHARALALVTAQSDRLKHNIEQFKTKWSEDPKARLDCLKDL